MYTRFLTQGTTLILLIVCMAISGFAEMPQMISYQGRLVDDTGEPVADGSYNLSFSIYEHNPVPMGESPMWTSGVQSVQVNDGLFTYMLGSAVPIPASVFTDPNWESHYLNVSVEGSVLRAVVQMVSVPFAYQAMKSDTAAYAVAGPGSGAVGWVDVGSTVRLETYTDFVGIGTNSPHAPLVVGKDLGSYLGQYVVSGSYYLDDVCGFKLGYNVDNHATLAWDGDGADFAIHTKHLGTSYNNVLAVRVDKVGIGISNPSENLVVGKDLGSYNGNRIVVGDDTPGAYTGLVAGEDGDNRGWLLWDIDDNFFGFGMESGGTQYNSVLTMKDGKVGIGTNAPSATLDVVGAGTGAVLRVVGSFDESVQLPTGAISSNEIMDEAGVATRQQTADYECASNVWDTVITQSCNFPDYGYAVVLVTAEVLFGSYLDANAEFGITDKFGSAPHSYLYNVSDESSGFTVGDNRIITIHETFSVQQETEQFAFVVKRQGSNLKVMDVRISVIYLPTTYTAGARTSDGQGEVFDFSRDADGNTFSTGEIGAPNSADQSSLAAEIADLRQANEQLLQRLEILEQAVKE